MPQFYVLFYANYTVLASQRGGHGTIDPPLNTPLLLFTVLYRNKMVTMLQQSLPLDHTVLLNNQNQ